MCWEKKYEKYNHENQQNQNKLNSSNERNCYYREVRISNKYSRGWGPQYPEQQYLIS